MHTFILIAISVLLLLMAAIFSGLNIGLLITRPSELKRKAAHGDSVAAQMLKYRANGNYLIVCILLGNVSVVSIFTLIIESLAGGIAAGITTTTLMTIFGEIIPQAIFARHSYRLSKYFFWLLDLLFIVLWPIAKPLSEGLNHFLGAELPTMFSREELTHLVEEHAQDSGSNIDADESRIVSGALAFSTFHAKDVMTPIDKVLQVDADDELDASLLIKLKNSGHSRFPVYDHELKEYVGTLFIKDVLGEQLPQPVTRFYRDRILDIPHDSRLDTVLSRFIQTKSHLFLVRDDDDKPIGIITLEDVIEEILKREIIDEFEPTT
jgi:metal transporter CNNM